MRGTHPAVRPLGVGVALTFVLGLVAIAPATSPAAAQVATSDRLQFCRDDAGQPFSGEIDILLLLDDTASLQRQDPSKTRFDVLTTVFDGISSVGGERRVNLAVFLFGSRVEPIFDFRPLEPSGVAETVQEIREKNVATQDRTNFTDAVQRAATVLSARPAQNCRVLLWFTDGNHDASGGRPRLENDVPEADALRTAFCLPGGLTERVRSQRINPFVLLLDPPEDVRFEQRLDASKDVFQVITGDPRPSFPQEDRPDRSPSAECGGPLGEQLGRVFAVSQSDELIAIISDFLNEFEAASRITAEVCPYNIGALDSLPLPDAHFIDWIALTDFAAGASNAPPTVDRMTVVTADGREIAASTVLEIFWTAGPSARYRIIESQRDLLEAGWQISLPNANELCLRSRPRDLVFRISSGEPAIDVVAPRSLPRRLWGDGQLRLSSVDGREITLDDALRSPEVRGRLTLVQGGLFTSDASLPARIVIDGAPSRNTQCSFIQIPRPDSLDAGPAFARGGLEAPATVIGSDCIVTPATRGEDGGVLDFAATIADLTRLSGPGGPEECRIGDDWHVVVNGQRIDGESLVLSPGGAPLSFTVASGTSTPNEDRDCVAVAVAPVELRWQSQSTAIPVGITADWKRRGSSSIAFLLVAVALLLAAALSLGLLWLLNSMLLKAPKGAEFFGAEVNGTLAVDSRGEAHLEWERGAQELDGRTNYAKGGGDVIKFGQVELDRVLPSLLQPFSEPALRVTRGGTLPAAVVSYPRASLPGAVPLDFDELITVTTVSTVPAEVDRPVEVQFVVLMRDSGRTESVARGFARLAAARQRELAREMQKLLEQRSPAASNPSKSRSGRSTQDVPAATVRERPSTADRGSAQGPRPRPGRDGQSGQAGTQPRPRDAGTSGPNERGLDSGPGPGPGPGPGGGQPRPRPK